STEMNSLCAWYRTAKNVYRPAITTLLVIPRPNQTTTREASATNGVLFSVTTARYKKFSSARQPHEQHRPQQRQHRAGDKPQYRLLRGDPRVEQDQRRILPQRRDDLRRGRQQVRLVVRSGADLPRHDDEHGACRPRPQVGNRREAR